MNNVQKWIPVLRKCKEFSEDQYELIANALENQFNQWMPVQNNVRDIEGIADFTRFALPMSRRVLGRLLNDGYEVNIVTPEVGEQFDNVEIGSFTPTEINLANRQHLVGDREASLCDMLADQIMTHIENNFPEKKIDLYLILVANSNNDFQLNLVARGVHGAHHHEVGGAYRFFGKLRKA